MTQISHSDNTVVVTFEYDALGRRIEKKDMLTLTEKRYYYDDQRIALQTSVSYGGTETDFRYFVYGNYIDEVLMMHRIAPAADFYYAHDHLYSPVAIFSQTGAVGERYEYDAYGSVRIYGAGSDGIFFTADDQLRSVSSALLANPYTFTGRELDSFDSNTFRIMYYRARYYDPQTGRFLQRDPLGVNPAGGIENPFTVQTQYSDGMNSYEYAKSAPTNYGDYLGLCKVDTKYIWLPTDKPPFLEKIEYALVTTDTFNCGLACSDCCDDMYKVWKTKVSFWKILWVGKTTQEACTARN